MTNRFWDSKNKYTQGFLHRFTHWTLEVNYRQHTLGSYIIFANRTIEKISDLEAEEIIELKKVMKAMETTLLSLETFNPDRFNYLQMGNVLHHLHFHGLPRYASPRFFDNKEWIDTTWGYVPVWNDHDETDILIAKLRDTLQPHLLNTIDQTYKNDYDKSTNSHKTEVE